LLPSLLIAFLSIFHAELNRSNLPMPPAKSFVAFLLFLFVIGGPNLYAHSAAPLYETVFVVGPDPQPLVRGTGNGPLGSNNGNVDSTDSDIIKKPLPSVSFQAFEGRKLNEDRSLRSVEMESPSQRVHLPSTSTSEDTVAKSRILVGETCNITNILSSFKFDDNSVENNGRLFIPPDPHGAAGVSRLVSVVNVMVEVRLKNGTLTFRKGLQNFFSGIPEALNSNRFFDPKVIYDEHAGRFVLVALSRNVTPEVSRIWLAVSKNETPDSISSWNQAYINSAITINGQNSWADYPGLEVDEEALYVTNNMFKFSDNRFAGERLWIIPKGVTGGFYSGGAFSYNVTDLYAVNGSATTTMPAQVHGSSGIDGSVGTFLVSVLAYSDGEIQIQIVTIFNPLSATPTYTNQVISLGIIDSGFDLPEARQLGTNSTIDAGDNRVYDVVWRNNTLWAVFSIDPATGVNRGQATAHWVRFRTVAGNVIFEAQGNLGGEGIANGTHTFYPSVAVNRRGIVAYGYGASSPTTYAGAYASIGTSEDVYTVKNGLAPYFRDFGSGRNRWGDYSGISVDPVDDSIWIFNEYADTVGTLNGGNGRWATVWARLDCTVSFSLRHQLFDVYSI
jgi:hypothetical protein